MKCSLCGTDLQPGNNICPSCGALNMGFEQQQPAPVNTPAQNTNNVVANGPQVINDMPAQAVPVQTPLQVSPEVQAQPMQEAAPADTTMQDIDNDGVIEQYEDLDAGEAEVVNATADMAAPTLEVEQENLTSGAQDISSSQNVSTYNPDEQIQEEVEEQTGPKEIGLDFQIPEVQEPDKVELDANGMQEVKTLGKTVGEIKEVKEKFSLKILKKKSLPRNLVIILVVCALVIGLLLGATLFAKQTYTPAGANTKKQNNNIQHVNDGKNNTTAAGNYVYKIPDKYDYDKTNGGLVVYSKNDAFKIFIKAVDGSYEHVAKSKDSIKRSIQALQSTDVSNIKEERIGNNLYIVVEVSALSRNRLIAVRNGLNDNLFYVEVVTADGNFDYSTIDIADDIINNATYTESIGDMEKVEVEDFGSMISTIGEAVNQPLDNNN